MIVLYSGAALLLISFAVHLAVWRMAVPVNQTLGLLIIFFATPSALLALALASGFPSAFAGLSAAELASLALLYASCALAYIVLYSAIAEQSPTLAIVAYVTGKGRAGCADAELKDHFARGDEIRHRLALMEQGGLIERAAGLYRLTRRGRRLAELFQTAGWILGLKIGG